MPLCTRARTIVFLLVIGNAVGQAAWCEPPESNQKYTLESDIFYLPEDEATASPYAKEICRLDVYHPEGVAGFPTIVFFHGGGLGGGKKSIPKALTEHGWGVVGVGYRLHPKVKHPIYIEDAAAAVAWVFQHIAERGGDPNKVFVTGTSAGGYLTAMVGLDKSYLAKHGIDANRIAGLIPVTGQMITHKTVRKEQGVVPPDLRPTIDQYAPLYHIRGDAPPTLCITGGWGVDMLMRAEENLYFVSMMKLVGQKEIEHVVIEGAKHGECGAQCWPHVIRFIEKRLAAMKQPATIAEPPRAEQ